MGKIISILDLQNKSKKKKLSKKDLKTSLKSKSFESDSASHISKDKVVNLKDFRSSINEEKRAHVRHELSKDLRSCVIIPGAFGGLYKIAMKDLSRGGCKFSVNRNFDLGDKFAFRIYVGSKAYIPFNAQIIDSFEEDGRKVYRAEVTQSSEVFRNFIDILDRLSVAEGALLKTYDPA